MENYTIFTSKGHGDRRRRVTCWSFYMPPLLHFNRKWTLGRGFAIFFSKSSLRAKTLRKTNVFASRHFKRQKVSFPDDLHHSIRLLWVFDQVLYWHLYISSHNKFSFFLRKAATQVLFVALTEDVAKTVKHAVILHVSEDMAAVIEAHLLIVVMATWTESVVHIFTGKFA